MLGIIGQLCRRTSVGHRLPLPISFAAATNSGVFFPPERCDTTVKIRFVGRHIVLSSLFRNVATMSTEL